jgi:asparagine synthase (glutamine-hydrolysing)
MDHYQPLKGIEKLLSVQEGLTNSPGLNKSMHLYERAARDGVDVILDGHGGDEVVGYGAGRLFELANDGHWLTLIPLTRTLSKLSGSSSLALYLQLLERFGSEHNHTRAARWLIRHIVRTMITQTNQNFTAWERYLAPAYVKEMDLKDRSQSNLVLTPEQKISDQQYQLRGLAFPGTASAFETLDKASAAAGVEVRYPFFDIRLVRFCLGLDSSEKLRPNQTRSILRRAMKDIYPGSVARRQDKTNFAPEIANGLLQYHDDILEQITLDRDGRLAQYVDMDNLRGGISEFRQNPLKMDGGDVLFFWRIAMLHIWLSRDSTGNDSAVSIK